MSRKRSEIQRTASQILEQYEIEKELADRLRHSTREERKNLYTDLYNELYERVPHHPQLLKKDDDRSRKESVRAQMKMLRRLLSSDITFLELGPGDCALSFEVAKYVKKVYAIDVSDEITGALHTPNNFELIISDGSHIDITPESIDVAFSNQLMEHLHPDDAIEQIGGIHRALVSGGVYICITPHRFSGPHDISRHFDDVATGFHLKEYTYKELQSLFLSAGFRKVEAFVGSGGLSATVSVFPMVVLESLLELLPVRARKKVSRVLLRNTRGEYLGINIIATK